MESETNIEERLRVRQSLDKGLSECNGDKTSGQLWNGHGKA